MGAALAWDVPDLSTCVVSTEATSSTSYGRRAHVLVYNDEYEEI